MSSGEQPPLIAHVIHHLVIGGLENGLVNLINHIPVERYRHVIICMDDYSDFRQRIKRPDVEVIAMHKKPGQDPATQWRLYQLFRRLRPDILHTRNLTALDALLPGTLAGVRRRLHGEHGRDVDDLDGENRKLIWLRRLHSPMIKRYVTVSRDLGSYLTERVGIAPRRIEQIYNGVDTDRFSPPGNGRNQPPACDAADFFTADKVVIGTVGRIQPVKNQMLLAKAFVQMLERAPELRATARLAIVGDGPLRTQVSDFLKKEGVAGLCWLPGARQDTADLYRAMDVFVLPSLGEGISNTILEAMASGLPVIATAVGGNVELVDEGVTGNLVQPTDSVALSVQLETYVRDPQLRRERGRHAREQALARFSLNIMLENYLRTYDAMMCT